MQSYCKAKFKKVNKKISSFTSRQSCTETWKIITREILEESKEND